jgi:NhaP-type Na+/H+ and K+/H+ antiporter
LSQIDPVSFLVIVAVAGAAGVLRTSLERRIIIPVVVLELVLGIVIGRQVLDLVENSDFSMFFGNLGLAMLFFFAGYEIDIERIKGRPLELAAVGWRCRSGSRSESGRGSRPPASCCRSSTPALRWRRPRWERWSRS